LPLTVLDHSLVQGNALLGIGTIDEIRGWFAKQPVHLAVGAGIAPARGEPLGACPSNRKSPDRGE
jgi:hypothetical protein